MRRNVSMYHNRSAGVRASQYAFISDSSNNEVTVNAVLSILIGCDVSITIEKMALSDLHFTRAINRFDQHE
jgi:hypothetical protein